MSLELITEIGYVDLPIFIKKAKTKKPPIIFFQSGLFDI